MYWMPLAQQERSSLAVPPARGIFRKKGLLLIDDDPHFCALFTTLIESLGVPGKAYMSLAEMTTFAELRNYDVAILDYYLQSFKGPEIAEYIDVFFRDLPVIMISGGQIEAFESKVWPACIKSFVSKASGPYAIVRAALNAVERVEAV